MKGYKGFGKGLVCNDKQYAENTVFEEEEAVICNKGMHFCENPLDVLDYYSLLDGDANLNEFAEVEALANAKTDDGKKFCTTKLRIGAKLSFSGFVKAAVDFVFEHCESNQKTSGNSAKLAASGDFAQLAASGNSAQLAANGQYSIAAGIGYENKAKAALGNWIVLAEWQKNAEGQWFPACVKAAQIDGETLKPDTFYALKNGEFKEV